MNTKSSQVQTVTAQDVRELKKALQGLPLQGQWQVERGDHGHASILVYDHNGNLHTEIRNKP